MVQTRDMIAESSFGAVALNSAEDTKIYETKFPAAVSAIKDKSIFVVWRSRLQEGVSPDKAKVIAYEATAEQAGGWVVKEDGQLYQLTAAEFAAQAPKSPKK